MGDRSNGLSYATSARQINIKLQAVDDQDYEALLRKAGDSNHEERANILARLVSSFRSKYSKLKVVHNSLKQELSEQI